MSNDEYILKKRSIVISGHQTSVTLENIFWQKLKEIAKSRNLSLSRLVAEIDLQRAEHGKVNLSSAIRVFVLNNLL
ncbi:hypothetical protein MNBD_ALPHA01-1604 [hydrothermal vent metagenome]|uniref:Ribbon-helix-helix domain-containing protein n=1 Tax=hydrothermal vent metagenome TaxID=652676 RepID=A0A3B0SNA1_9ZZZZ